MYPKPAVLVGSVVKGKPNFMTIANCGIVNYDPPMLGVASSKRHYTNKGIRKEKAFSVNVPSTGMAKITDYCGLYSGSDADKSELFKVFYGELKTAPLIEECPVSFECELVKTVTFDNEYFFIGRVVEIYADRKCMTGEKLDIRKIDPLIYSTSDRKYFQIGKEIGKAYNIGKRKKDE